MISSLDVALLRRIKPRTGLHLDRWELVHAHRIDRLYDAGLILWGTESNYRHRSKLTPGHITAHLHRHKGMRLILTPKGQMIRNKL